MRPVPLSALLWWADHRDEGGMVVRQRVVLAVVAVVAVTLPMANEPARAAPSQGCIKVISAFTEQGTTQGEIFFDKTVTIDRRYIHGTVRLAGSCDGATMQVDDQLIFTN